jgi:predicted double-glycine peptidase
MTFALRAHRSLDKGRGTRATGAAVFFVILSWTVQVAAQSTSASVNVAPVATGAGRELRVASMRELRDRGVVRQQRDYSCGAAALATLLTYGLNEATSEESILRGVFEPLSGDQLIELQKNGLSLRHLQQVAEQRGFKAQGFRLGADQLSKLQRPVIVFIRPGGYRHFAVLKGVRDGRAYLADPSLGNVRMPLTRFVEQWADADDPAERGVIFAVERADATWPAHYGLQIDPGPVPPLETGAALRLTDPTSSATRLTPIR